MNAITLMKLPDKKKFLDVVDRSLGTVTIHLADGSQYDLKQNDTVRRLLQTLKPGPEGLFISLSDSKDVPAFMSYMIGC